MGIYKINSLDDLRAYAKDLARTLKSGDIVGLEGVLGAGKTTLVQMIAQELGVREPMRSPSFTIVKEHDIKPSKRGIKKLCHIDLYRVDKGFDSLGLEEYFDDKDSILFIEWAEKIKKHLPKNIVWIRINVNPDGSRAIKK